VRVHGYDQYGQRASAQLIDGELVTATTRPLGAIEVRPCGPVLGVR
jgi:hypothetical protein